MIDRARTCAFTGHRENKLPNENDARCIALKENLRRRGKRCTPRESGTLSAEWQRADTYFCEAVMALRGEHRVTIGRPSLGGPASRWSGPGSGITGCWRCDCQTLVQKHYSADCMMRRNRYMVESSPLSSPFGSPGGTMNNSSSTPCARAATPNTGEVQGAALPRFLLLFLFVRARCGFPARQYVRREMPHEPSAPGSDRAGRQARIRSPPCCPSWPHYDLCASSPTF